MAYGAGFAGGTFVGMVIEEKIAMGKVLIRVITNKKPPRLLKDLREKGFEATLVRGEGLYGHVRIIFVITKRQSTNEVIQMIQKFDSHAFYMTEDIRFAHEDNSKHPPKMKASLFRTRKGK